MRTAYQAATEAFAHVEALLLLPIQAVVLRLAVLHYNSAVVFDYYLRPDFERVHRVGY